MTRDYPYHDLKLLDQLKAPLDDEKFKDFYFQARDVWKRMYQGDNAADMKLESLHMLVFLWELGVRQPPSLTPVEPAKKQKAVA